MQEKYSTIEYKMSIEGLQNCSNFVKQTAIKEFKNHPGVGQFNYYFTFLPNDYEMNMISIIVTDNISNYFYATLPYREESFALAWGLLVKYNVHTKLELIYAGLNGEDFLHERITAKIKYK